MPCHLMTVTHGHSHRQRGSPPLQHYSLQHTMTNLRNNLEPGSNGATPRIGDLFHCPSITLIRLCTGIFCAEVACSIICSLRPCPPHQPQNPPTPSAALPTAEQLMTKSVEDGHLGTSCTWQAGKVTAAWQGTILQLLCLARQSGSTSAIRGARPHCNR